MYIYNIYIIYISYKITTKVLQIKPLNSIFTSHAYVHARKIFVINSYKSIDRVAFYGKIEKFKKI